jgi:ATP-dependent Zn protease
MEEQSIQISNSSNDKCILVNLSSPENSDSSKDKRIEISRNSVKKINTKGGVMNMAVWEKRPSQKIIWKGVIPTKIDKILIINPEETQVIYDGMEIPNFLTSLEKTSENFMKIESMNNENNSLSFWNYFIIMFLLIIIIGIFSMIFRNKYYKKK